MTRSSAKTNKEYMLLEHIKEWTGSCQIGDDCAVLANGLLASVDTLVEDVHFSLDTANYYDVGWKSVAVNLSDIAAMAGRPRTILVSLTLPSDFSLAKVRELYKGIVDCARTYRVKVEGGDLTSGKNLSISVSVLGEVHEQGLLTRNQARPSDFLIATGDFGASRAGLYSLCADLTVGKYCVRRHLRPLPRLCESWALLRSLVGHQPRAALMDASDGLADAVYQLSRASLTGAIIDSQKVPVDKETISLARHAGVDPLDWALYGGEDFELVASIDKSSWETLNKHPGENPFKIIGTFTESLDVAVRSSDGELKNIDVSLPFQHF